MNNIFPVIVAMMVLWSSTIFPMSTNVFHAVVAGLLTGIWLLLLTKGSD